MFPCRISESQERPSESGPVCTTRSDVVRATEVIAPDTPRIVILLLCSSAFLVTGCRQDMGDQPRYEALASSDFFPDGRASREPPQGTVARGQLRIDQHFYFGKQQGVLAASLPMPLTKELLDRGEQRFNIFCAPCHDRVGTGRGMVVQRGFPPPPTFHSERLRTAPIGHYFDVITNGFGRMPDHRDQIPAADRWAIAAYVRALQLSQQVPIDDLESSDLEHFEGDPAAQ